MAEALTALEELEQLRAEFVKAPGCKDPDTSRFVKAFMFRSSGLFDAIISRMTEAEVPEGHIVVVTDVDVEVMPDFRKENPPLTTADFEERLSLLGKKLIAFEDPRTNPTVSAFLDDRPDALGNLPRTTEA